MRRAVLLALLPLAACTAAQPGPQVAAGAPAYEAIAFEIFTWGRLLGSWEAHPDGRVRHAKVDGSVFAAHRLEHREFLVDHAQFAKLAAMAADLPDRRPDAEDCNEQVTDLPYGTLQLTRGGAEEDISFDTGCLDKPYQAFVGKLQAMDELVAEWAEHHAATKVEELNR